MNAVDLAAKAYPLGATYRGAGPTSRCSLIGFFAATTRTLPRLAGEQVPESEAMCRELHTVGIAGHRQLHGDEKGLPDVGWLRPDGRPIIDGDWNSGCSRTVMVLLDGDALDETGPAEEK